MPRYALIGRTLGHSWSQRWFEEMFRRLGLDGYSYCLHEMDTLDGLRQWVEDEGIDGFNVTIPYKRAIVPLLDALSPEAEAIGAVNCVAVSGKRLIGYNTDTIAFGETIDGKALNGAIILGTGGAARAVAYALENRGIEYRLVSRTPSGKAIGYQEATALPERYDMMVNATPVGMWPKEDATPWHYDLERFKTVYDLIYNPSPTLLLRQAAAAGAATIDGLEMLHRQAELSWQLWQQ